MGLNVRKTNFIKVPSFWNMRPQLSADHVDGSPIMIVQSRWCLNMFLFSLLYFSYIGKDTRLGKQLCGRRQMTLAYYVNSQANYQQGPNKYS